MKIDQRAVNELLSSLGINQGNTDDVVKSLKNKSEEELVAEIRRAKRTLQRDPAKYRKQVAAVRSMRGMLGAEQKKRFDMIIRVLDED